MQHKKRLLADGTIKIYVYSQDVDYYKKYYEENKEKILNKISCECGLKYQKCNKKRPDSLRAFFISTLAFP